MAKTGLLGPLQVDRETKAGRYCDGGGLYLEVKPGGTKVWLLRYKHDGQAKTIGLGPFSATNSLATARKKAAALRGLLENGIDPQKDRADKAEQQRLEVARAMTFEQCAETFIAGREAGWRNSKHRQRNGAIRLRLTSTP
jgi:Arm DNA-binding domain